MQRLIPKDLMEKIFELWIRGVTVRDLASEYGLCEHTMSKYIRQYEKGVVEEWK